MAGRLLRVACPGSCLGSVSFDDRLHLLLGQVGMQAFAEFTGEGVDEGLHGGLDLEVYSAPSGSNLPGCRQALGADLGGGRAAVDPIPQGISEPPPGRFMAIYQATRRTRQ